MPSTHANDADLVRASQRGDRSAFDQLVRRYLRPLCGFVSRRLGRPQQVEDLVQETFLEAFRSLPAVREPERFSSWLFGIAVHRCGKWLRKPRLATFPADQPPDAAATVDLVADIEEQERLQSAVDRAIASLPPEIRDLLRLKHEQGLTCDQLARRLGKPTGTIKSLLARTYQELRSQLATTRGGEA